MELSGEEPFSGLDLPSQMCLLDEILLGFLGADFVGEFGLLCRLEFDGVTFFLLIK